MLAGNLAGDREAERYAGRMSQTLPEVLSLLEQLAPLRLAEEWDNVGLLSEPSAAVHRPIERVFVCIDLSESVLDEALARNADFLLVYHPPIFRGLKRLRASVAEERVLLRTIEAGLAVYSPHTALDAARGGVNDWLARAFGAGRSSPLVAAGAAAPDFKLVVFVPRSHVSELRQALSRELGAGKIGNYSECSYELEGQGSFFGSDASSPRIGERGQLEFVSEVRLEMRCPSAALKDLARVIAAHHPYEEPAWDVYPLLAPPGATTGSATEGAGRLLELDTPLSVMDAVARLKAQLGVTTLRVAISGLHAAGAPITRVAVCAGAGGGLFEKSPAADLFVTGEMRHHDVLAKLRRGASVLLSEHTHTERGFLPIFARQLEAAAQARGQLEVLVSQVDADPLRTL